MLENSSNGALGHIFKLRSIGTSSIVRSLEKNLHFLPCFIDVNTRLWAFLQHTIPSSICGCHVAQYFVLNYSYVALGTGWEMWGIVQRGSGTLIP